MLNILNTLIQISFIYCIIVFLVLALRRPMYRIAGAKWVYAMWFSLFIPLVILIAPNSTLAFLSHLPTHEFSLPARVNSMVSFESHNVITVTLLVLWTGGVIATIWRTARNNFKFAYRVKAKSQRLSGQQAREIGRFCKRASVFPAPEVRCSADINGPALLGIINPVLLLPTRFFDRFNQPEQALMIFHELVHFSRKDAWWNLVFCALRCVFWFNPLMWFAERRFRLDQELSCDQSVLLNETSAQKRSYAEAMLKVASPKHPQNLIGFQNNSPEILTRVTQLQHHRPSLFRSVFGPVCCALLLMLATVLSAPDLEGNYPMGVTSAWCGVYQDLRL